ncbi:FecCD family ABC transporter permease [Sphingomicrobium aestuariivivum]|uniref:FecCD family ABC transporter permease n=1 Tax=Sphingomicrobium aestuariivivum TaxID=1582356 RepID=UPI001FD67F9A|nr:iron ABC transporter permease [Sphingomicrobium aestuariivivum]MCJ8189813.1 iron ABC transporter permease [Sphingomicrobium aestuariivivum]
MSRLAVRLGPPLLLAVMAALHFLLPFDLFALDDEIARAIMLELRAPRTLLAIGYGAALGITGAALQAVFANPLASPDITGAASGGALGAVATGHFLALTSPLALAVGGAAGSGLALLGLFLIAGRGADPARLLLAGLSIALAAGAATSLLLALAPSPFAFYDQWRWLMGSLVDSGWPDTFAALVPAGLAGALLWRDRRNFDLLALGEDVAASYGVAPQALARRTILLSAIAIGACVAACGAIGFVGLIAPIAARSLSRGHPGRALLPAAFLGAALLLAADLMVRAAPDGRPIPIGVVTALIGTPLFILLLMRMKASTA